MENQEEFNEKLKKIEDDAIMKVSEWWGKSRNPGCSGTIITKNKELYSYKYYYFSNKLENENTNLISKNKELNIEEYNKVIKFIENEIINKEFDYENWRDYGCDVTVNYNGIIKTIVDNSKIYDKVKPLIDELLKDESRLEQCKEKEVELGVKKKWYKKIWSFFKK